MDEANKLLEELWTAAACGDNKAKAFIQMLLPWAIEHEGDDALREEEFKPPMRGESPL